MVRTIMMSEEEYERFCAFRGAEKTVSSVRAQGLQVQAIQSAGKAKHVFTHVEWRLEGVAALVEGTLGTARFVTPKELEEEYCLPSAFAAYVQKLPALWAAISAGPEA